MWATVRTGENGVGRIHDFVACLSFSIILTTYGLLRMYLYHCNQLIMLSNPWI